LQASHPAWSPDGTQIAFAGYPRTGSDTSFRREPIYLVSSDGGDLHRVSRTAAEIVGMSWTPDGTHMAAAAFGASDAGVTRDRIVSLDTRTGEERTLAETDAQNGLDAYPAWSPDGRLIASTRYDRPIATTSLWTMNADGSGQRKLVDDGANPSWSPPATGCSI
jgi:TolB protein